MDHKMLERFRTGRGFIAALDQSGGSTPGALEHYGIARVAYSTDAEMFDLMHEMRARIMRSPSFTSERILGAILFEDTLKRAVSGRPVTDYLWSEKGIVPFLKVDKGLAEEEHGVQLMKAMPDLEALLSEALEQHVLGTKMRSFIQRADDTGISAIVSQQFSIGHQIASRGLLPILEPEIDIHSPEKLEAETLLRDAIGEELDRLESGELVALKLTLPEVDDFYVPFVQHPNVVRVLALSGGYSQADANERLARNHGTIASFSRALSEGLFAWQSDEEFDELLKASCERIYQASLS